MALDWNKEIHLGSVLASLGRDKSPRGGSSAYPTKTTMNLYQGDTQATDVRKVILTAVLLAVGIALFVKFGVLDQLDRVAQKEAELAAQQRIALSLTQEYGDFGDVKELYDAYQARLGNDAVDVIAVLDMVEKEVKPEADVSTIVVSDGTLTLTLYNVALDKVGDLAKRLEGQDLVQAVNVSTATTQNAKGKNTVSTLNITLVGIGNEEE